MTLDLSGAWTAMLASPLFGLTLTVGVFGAARWLWRRSGGRPGLTPVFVATVVISGVLVAFDIPYEQYMAGARYIDVLLVPATVALAVAVYRELPAIRAAWALLATSALAGVGAGVLTGAVVTRVLGGSERLAVSMAPTSTTTPVSLALSGAAGGFAELTAALTIVTGIVGAVVGPRVMTALGLRDRRVRGLAMGVSAHGIGTSRALLDHPVEGAFSALGMALGALTTSVVMPVLVAVL